MKGLVCQNFITPSFDIAMMLLNLKMFSLLSTRNFSPSPTKRYLSCPPLAARPVAKAMDK